MHYTVWVEQVATSEKLVLPPRLQAAVDRVTKGPRLIICDRCDGTIYLIDTGADVSVIPRNMVRGILRPTDIRLFAANNTVINTYGFKMRSLDLGLRRTFKWNFVVAEVKQPMISADFLAHHGLLPDLKNRKLIDEQTLLHSNAEIRVTRNTCHHCHY